ncbi:hypothetical protein KKF91_17110 [Myxococcota bacterium]|nr:hypothetical protein [Myxococcota bacterium]MBU1432259.1 hypothetical protein [Myxococcota bacterium]MBU1899777.1 hypothetical protein [Myxococcota bacterium]
MSNSPAEQSPEVIPYPEYLLRILFATFYPAVKMAVDFNYPLDTVKDMMTLAMWREAKRKHSTINLISLIFGKSTRTIKALSARFNKGGFFEANETNLMRRLEDLLREGPLNLTELSERLPHSNEFDSTQLAVKALLREGRIQVQEGTRGGQPSYKVVEQHLNLVSDSDWEARVDALYEHLEALTETVRRRFLDDEPHKASARTFTFRARPAEIEAFLEDLYAFIRARTLDLETNCAGEGVDLEAEAEIFSLYLGGAPKRGES